MHSVAWLTGHLQHGWNGFIFIFTLGFNKLSLIQRKVMAAALYRKVFKPWYVVFFARKTLILFTLLRLPVESMFILRMHHIFRHEWDNSLTSTKNEDVKSSCRYQSSSTLDHLQTQHYYCKLQQFLSMNHMVSRISFGLQWSILFDSIAYLCSSITFEKPLRCKDFTVWEQRITIPPPHPASVCWRTDMPERNNRWVEGQEI